MDQSKLFVSSPPPRYRQNSSANRLHPSFRWGCPNFPSLPANDSPPFSPTASVLHRLVRAHISTGRPTELQVFFFPDFSPAPFPPPQYSPLAVHTLAIETQMCRLSPPVRAAYRLCFPEFDAPLPPPLPLSSIFPHLSSTRLVFNIRRRFPPPMWVFCCSLNSFPTCASLAVPCEVGSAQRKCIFFFLFR